MEFKEFYKNIQDYLSINFFMSVYSFVKRSKVAPANSSQELLKTLAYLHCKNWLYYSQENGKLVTVIGAYRIKEFNKEKITVMPEEEEGDILFIPINASTSKDKLIYRKLLKGYLEENPNVNELIFHDRNSNEIKRYPLKRKENVATKIAQSAEHPTISK